MADYNPNYMAAYKQYGQSMIAGGGGSNMSGTGSSTMQAFLDSQDDDKPTGLGAKPKPTTTTTQDDGPSFWERITQAFTDNEVDVTNVYQPSVDPSQVYNQDIFKIAPVASDYVYRAEMSEQTQDMVEQAMGYEPPMTSLAEQMGVMDINSYDPNTGANALNISQIVKLPREIQDNIFREMHEGKDSLLGDSSVNTLRLVDTSYMSDEEKKQFAPLIKLADDIRNENITSSELPTVLSNNQIKDLAAKAIAAGTFSRDNVEDDIFYQNLLDAITSAGPQGEPYTLDQPQGEPYTLDEEASLMDALMEGQPTGLMSRPSSFTGGSVDVASNMPDWMAELSAIEMINALRHIDRGLIDPATGQAIQSAEDVARETEGQPSGRLDGKDGTIKTKEYNLNKAQLESQAREMFSNNPLAGAAFIATVNAESGGGTDMTENGYSKAQAVKKFVDPYKRDDGTLGPKMTARKEAILASESPEEIFEIVYGAGYTGNKNLGNTEVGDGYRFIGRGPIQLTGRANYEKYGKMAGVDLVNNPELMAVDQDVSLAVTKAYLDDKGLSNVRTARDLYNVIGHSGGMSEANKRWKQVKKIYESVFDMTFDEDRMFSVRPRLRP